MSWQIALARIRIPLFVGGIIGIIVLRRVGLTYWLSLGILAGLYVIAFRLGKVELPPTVVTTPVRGRWSALNSPADRVPSHGVHAYGQGYAIDLVAEPADGARPGFGWWPPARPPRDFPAFGAPVLAPVDGIVIRARGRARDHWSRNSWPALPYLLASGMLREITGPGRLLGNHVIIEADDGKYVACAHLRRDSIRVGVGDRVRAGEAIAEVGNTGNSSEPHLHVQVMDHGNVLIAAGLPMHFDRYEIDGVATSGMPRANTSFDVPAANDSEAAVS